MTNLPPALACYWRPALPPALAALPPVPATSSSYEFETELDFWNYEVARITENTLKELSSKRRRKKTIYKTLQRLLNYYEFYLTLFYASLHTFNLLTFIKQNYPQYQKQMKMLMVWS